MRWKSIKTSLFGLDFFQAYKIFWLKTYFSNPLCKKLDDPPKNTHCDFRGPVMTHTAEKFDWIFKSLLINLFNLIKSSLKIQSNFSAVWVITGLRKSTCVFFDGSSNFLQRDFAKYFSSQKILYAWKKPKPYNHVFIDFHLKNYSFSN